MTEVAFEAAFPHGVYMDTSRMNRAFKTKQVLEESRVVLLKISRGGDTPTHYARKHLDSTLLEPCEILQASSQRVARKKKSREKKRRNPKTVYSVKGKTDLTGKILIVFEQAHASAGTVINVIPAAIKKCESKPDRIIICCINSCEYAIRRTLKRIPGAIVIDACFHLFLTLASYLDFIGCGDCGAEEHRVSD